MFENGTSGRILEGKLGGRRQPGMLTNIWEEEVREGAAKLHTWPAAARRRPKSDWRKETGEAMSCKQG
jgi:hypothetical protein